MPSGIMDNRIVQMKFENSQFERNIAKSTKSLADFKEELKFGETTSGLKKFFQNLSNIDLSGLADNVSRLADKFTGLGHISEMVLTNIQAKIRSVVDSMSSFVDSMTTAQIEVGKGKYEMLNKSVQTIMNATGKSEQEVYAVMERLNKYTDQTSYDFADMAQNISKFTSVGIPLADAERQMEGIANWAAKSGAGITEASRAMYNLSQAMGVGKLTMIDWKSIENAGMATREFKQQLIDSAVAAGTIEKKVTKLKNGVEQVTYKTAKSLGKQVEVTVDNVGSTLNKGWADKKVLSSTLDKYYWDDLYYEGTEAIMKLTDEQQKAFDKMMTNHKLDAKEWKQLEKMGVLTTDVKQKILDLAVSQGKLAKSTDKNGKTIYTTVSKNGKKIKVTLDNIAETLSKGWFDEEFGKSVTSINELGKSAYEAAQKCTTFTDVLQAWKDMISTGWMNSFRYIFGDLGESMQFFSDVCNKVSEDLDTLISFRNEILKGWGENGGRKSLFESILGVYGDEDEDESEPLVKLARLEVAVEDKAYGLIDVLHDVGKLISDAFWDLLKPFASNEVGALWDMDDGKWRVAWLTNQLLKFTESIQTFLQGVRNFFNEDIVVNGEVTTRLQMIKNMIDGVVGAVIIAANVVGGIAEFVGTIIQDLMPSFDTIEFTFSKIGEAIYGTATEATESGSIINFFRELAETTKPLTTGINDLVGSLSKLILNILDWGSKDGNFETFATGFTDAIKSVTDAISNFGGPIFHFFGDLIDILADLFASDFSEESMAAAGEKVGIAFNKMTDTIVANLPQGLKDFWAKVKGIFSKENKEGQEKTEDKDSGGILGFFKDWDLSKVLGVAGGALGLGAFWKLYSILTKIRNPLGAAVDIIGNIKDNLFGAIKDLIMPEDPKGTGLYIMGLGAVIAAVGYLVSQVVGLAKEDVGWEGIGRMVAGLVATFGIILGFVWATKKMKLDYKNMLAIGGLAYGVQAIIVALKPLADMEWGDLGRMGAGLAGVLIALLATAKLTSKFENGADVKLKGLMSLALGIAVLIIALRPLADIEWENLGKMGAGLVVVLGALGLFAKWVSSFENDPSVALKGIIGLVVGIAILVFALKPLASMEWEQLGKMGAGLAGILIALGMFAKWVYNFKNADDPSVALKGIIGLVAGIAILVFALTPLANMEWEQLGKMGAGLAFILIALGTFANRIYNFRDGADASVKVKGILELVASIAILVFSLKPLADIEWENLGKMGAGLAVIMFALIHFAKKVYEFPGNPSTKVAGVIGLAVGIGLVVLSLLPLANLEWKSLGKMGAGLGVIMIALLGFSKAMSKIDFKKGNIIDLLAYAGAISAIVLAFGLSLLAVQGVDIKTILAFSVGISLVLVAMAAAMKLTGTMGIATGIKAIALIAVGMAAIMGVLALMIPVLMGSLGNSLQSLGGRLRLVGSLFSDFTSIMGGIGGSEIDDAQGKMDKIKELVQSLSGFGNYTQVTDNFSTALWTLSTGLEIFAEHMRAAGDFSNLGIVQLLKDLQENYEGVNSLASLNLSHLEANIAGLGGAMMLYAMGAKDVAEANGVEGVDEQAITAAVKIMNRIAETMVTDGEFVIPKMPPSEEIGLWGARLAALAGALVSFEQAGQGLGSGTDKALEILDFFKKLKERLESTNYKENMAWVSNYMSAVADEDGRLINVQTGEELVNNADVMLQFGAHIEQLGKALAGFAASTSRTNETTGEITPINYDNAIKALDTFMSIKEKLPNVGGVVSWVTGTKKDLIDLGTEIEGLGGSLTNFSALVNGEKSMVEGEAGTKFDPAAVTKATDAITQIYTCINDINAKLSPLGTAGTDFSVNYNAITWTGEDIGRDIGALGEGLAKLGGGLTDFSTKTDGSGFDPTSTENAVSAMEAMVNFMQRVQFKLPVIGGIGDAFHSFITGHKMTISELAGYLGELGDGLAKLGKGIVDGGYSEGNTGANDAFELLDNILDIATKLGQLNSVSTESGSVTAWMDNLVRVMDELANWHELSTGYTPEHSIIEGLVSFMAQLNNALEDVEPDMEKLKSLVIISEIIANLSNVNPGADIKAIGFMITNGTADGIKEGTNNLIIEGGNMITNVFNSFLEGGSNALDFAPIGESIAGGIAIGITNGQSIVNDAITALLTAAYNAGAESIEMGSPSRKFAIMGNFAAQGFGVGVTEGTHYATDAAALMGKKSIDSVANVISTMGLMLDQDLDANPTISPVIDLSNFNHGIGTMQRALSDNDMRIDTSVIGRRAMNSLPYRSTQEVNQNGRDYSGLYSRIEEATGRIDSLGDKIAQMKLVLDGEVVAGGITSSMDRNLGREMFYASRNN